MAETDDILQLINYPGFDQLSPEEQLKGIKKMSPAFADAQIGQLPEIKHKIKRSGMGMFAKAVDWMDNPQDEPTPGMQPRTTGQAIHHALSTLGGFQNPEKLSNRIGSAVTAGVPATFTGGPVAGGVAAASGFAHPMKDASDLAINVASAGIPMLPKMTPGVPPGMKEVAKQGLKGAGLTQLLHMIGTGANMGAEAMGLQKPPEVPREMKDMLAGFLPTALGAALPAMGQHQSNKVANSPVAVSERMREMITGGGKGNTFANLPGVVTKDTSAAAAGPWAAARQQIGTMEQGLEQITANIKQVDGLIAQSKTDVAKDVANDVTGGTIARSVRAQKLAQLNQQRDQLIAQKAEETLKQAGLKAQTAGLAFDQAVQEERALLQPNATATPFPGAKKNNVTGRFESAQGPRTLDQLQMDAITEGENNIVVLNGRLREANRLGDKKTAQSIDNAIVAQQKQNLARKASMKQLTQQQQQAQAAQEQATSHRDTEAASQAWDISRSKREQASLSRDIGTVDAQKRAVPGSPTSQAPAIRALGSAEQRDFIDAKARFAQDFEDLKGQASRWDSQNVGVRTLAWDSDSPQAMLDKIFSKDSTADQIKGLRAHLQATGQGNVDAFQDVMVDHFMKLAYDDTTKTFAKADKLFDSMTGVFNQDKVRELFGPVKGPEMADRFRRAISDVNRSQTSNNTLASRAESAAVWMAPSALLWNGNATTVSKLATAGALGVMGVEWPRLINKILRDSKFADQFHSWMTGPSKAQRSITNWPRIAAWMKDNSTPVDQAEVEKARQSLAEQKALEDQQQEQAAQQAQQAQQQQSQPGSQGNPAGQAQPQPAQ